MYEAEAKLKTRFGEQLPEGKSRRILFWYDESQAYAEEVEAYQLESVHLLKVNDHNLIWSKYQIEKEHPQDDFLLYFDTGRPHDMQNPLIDIYLYGEEFKMDALATLMDEIGMTSRESEKFFQDHASFFQNKRRQKEFRDLVLEESERDVEKLTLATFCVLAKVKELSFSVLCEQLFLEEAQGNRETWSQIEKFAYPKEFWELAADKYHYQEKNPTIQDFLLSVFVTKLAAEYEEKVPANWQAWILSPKNNSIVFLNRWMNHSAKRDDYGTVAAFISDQLKFAKFLKRKPLEFAAQSDSFREIEEYLTEELAQSLLETPILYGQLEQLIQGRRNSFWFSEFASRYQALLAAVRLLKRIEEWGQQPPATDSSFLWDAYQNHYYQLDQDYRHFYLAFDRLGAAADVFDQLQDKVENFYKNGFLNPFAERWTQAWEDKAVWEMPHAAKQEAFYKQRVAPFVKEQKRIFVIISDALRYEAAQELADELADSHYYTVETSAMRGVVPSYTALGMASLLPHEKLTFKEKQLLVDGQSSQGLQNRERILDRAVGAGKGKAFQARDILQATKAEMREVFAGGQVFYIYHNAIDAAGDTAPNEDRVFQAVETTKQEILRLADKLVNNVSAANLLVTADHGFLYTREPLIKAEKLPAGFENAIANNRRFYMDQNAESVAGMHTFAVTGVEEPNLYVHIPYGTMRLAISGAGDRFVHGGSLPQETMIPVLAIRAERGRDTRKRVEVQLISEGNRITNVVTHLSFLQMQKVSRDYLARTVRAGFVDGEGNLISNEVMMVVDSTNESPGERIIKEKFIFSNRPYHNTDEYYFFMEDASSDEELEKRRFTIDLYFVK